MNVIGYSEKHNNELINTRSREACLLPNTWKNERKFLLAQHESSSLLSAIVFSYCSEVSDYVEETVATRIGLS